MDFFNILVIPFVFLIGFATCNYAGKSLKISSINVIILYVWHSLFCILYYYLTLDYGGDAQMYYREGANGDFKFGVGTAGIIMIVHILANYFYFSEIAVYLTFNIFGVLGLLLFFHCLSIAARDKLTYVKKLVWLIILLPSISYWSSATGKDPLSFLAVTLSMWSALALRNRMFAMLAAISLMFFVRPHMAVIMIVALNIAVIFGSKNSLFKKSLLVALVVALTYFIGKFVIGFAGLGDISNINELAEFIEKRQGFNMEGSSGIDISNMSFFEKLFAYMFRPTFLEINSILTFAAAFDNLILKIIFFWGIYKILKGTQSYLGESRVFMWSYSLIAWVVVATTTANMGIALRQKWMFVPCLIFLIISIMPQKRKTQIYVHRS